MLLGLKCKKTRLHVDIPEQPNGLDCGVFTCQGTAPTMHIQNLDELTVMLLLQYALHRLRGKGMAFNQVTERCCLPCTCFSNHCRMTWE